MYQSQGTCIPGMGPRSCWARSRKSRATPIVIEARDTASGTVNRVRILLQADTRFRIDKEPLSSLDGMVGQRAIVSVDWEDERGGQTLRATEVRFTRPKKK